MIPVTFRIELAEHENGWRRRYAKRTVDLPAVPVPGCWVQIESGGWSEPIRDGNVWLDLGDGTYAVDITSRIGMTFFKQPSEAGEDLAAALEAAGWDVTP